MGTDRKSVELAVVEVREETPDSRTFVLEVPSALSETFAYRAGQYCTFNVTIDGRRVERSYSMSSAPGVDRVFAVTVKRVANGRMSNWLIDHVGVGDRLAATPPLGRFVLRDSEAPIVAFCGGSGVTPVFSLLKTVLAAGSRSFRLICANRAEDDILFREALAALAGEHPDRFSLYHHLDSERGLLDAEACAGLVGPRSDVDAYVCGPEPFMEVARAGLAARGVEEGRIFVESFGAPAEPEEEGGEGEGTQSLEVRIRGGIHRLEYRSGDTLLAAARAAGLDPPSSCQAGNCGSCMAKVAPGTAGMRMNNALSDEEVEEGWVLTCQARPIGKHVVVDYDA